jgi:long-chain acyl-CoA synthetase
VRHVVVASMGEMLGGAKGMLVNFVVRNVKKMVPDFSLPKRCASRMRWRRARACRSSRRSGPDDVAFLQYTGGTTGVSKGATLTHRNVIANVLQSEAWLAAGDAQPPHGRPFPTIVCALPLYHIFALTACACGACAPAR